MPTEHALTQTVRDLITQPEPQWQQALQQITTHFDCPVGTAHLLGDDGMLHLKSQQGLPPPVLDKVQIIPIGKGMAGIAAERKEPVQVCNLQQDDSGVARPGAKLTQMEGSIAVPMLVNGELRGTLGVAKPTAYDFSEEEVELLMAIAAALASA